MAKYTLGIDPSGAFNQGKGTTGWCVIDSNNHIQEYGSIKALDYECAEAYWEGVLEEITKIYTKYNQEVFTVLENYILYANAVGHQINSEMETCRLIGAIQTYLHISGRDYALTLASAVKNRWSNEVLERKQILPKRNGLNKHEIDALRHAVHSNYLRDKYIKRRKRKHKKVKEFYNYE